MESTTMVVDDLTNGNFHLVLAHDEQLFRVGFIRNCNRKEQSGRGLRVKNDVGGSSSLHEYSVRS
jgi:hypothetical protein